MTPQSKLQVVEITGHIVDIYLMGGVTFLVIISSTWVAFDFVRKASPEQAAATRRAGSCSIPEASSSALDELLSLG